MLCNDIRRDWDWKETLEEQLYKNDYEHLPSFMKDCLLEYFEEGGTSVQLNKTYSFSLNDEVNELVNDLYEEWKIILKEIKNDK